jgi:hypothetical protein
MGYGETRVRPKELTCFLLNPHKGFCTFQRFNGDPLSHGRYWSEVGPTEFPDRVCDVAEGYLPTTVAYCRWFWDTVEPEEGRLDFTVVEKALETARQRGQTLHVRLMPTGAHDQVHAPAWYLEKYPTQVSDRFQSPYRVPVYDSPPFIELWGRVVSEFGARFDRDPTLDCVDMSWVGAWGEGHGDCSNEAADRMSKIYADAHPLTPRVAMIGTYKMIAGLRTGAGWRCDSCDDLGLWADRSRPWSQWWNHLYDAYPQAVVECGAQNSWQTAPVVFETGDVLSTDYELGFDIDFVIRQNLKYHGSVFSPKSTRLPEPWLEKLQRFANDLGYRFVLRQITFTPWVDREDPRFQYRCWVENVGVAPLYYPYSFALKFTQGNRTHIHISPADVTGWLPGDVFFKEEVLLPEQFVPGAIAIHAGLVDQRTQLPKVAFASEGRDEEGWLALDRLELR